MHLFTNVTGPVADRQNITAEPSYPPTVTTAFLQIVPNPNVMLGFSQTDFHSKRYCNLSILLFPVYTFETENFKSKYANNMLVLRLPFRSTQEKIKGCQK